MNYLFDHYAKSILNSSSQIMLQKNAVTGLLFLVGIGVNSMTMLLGCLLAILSSLATTQLCQYDFDLVNKGFYGFSAALVGIAVLYLLPLNFTALVLVMLGGALSALLMHFMMTKIPNIPALTTPFIFSTWIIVLIIDYAGLASSNLENQASQLSQLSVVATISLSSIDSRALIDPLQGALRGVGQVMLQDNWLSGVIFFCALLLNSSKAAVWAILASFIGFLMAKCSGFPPGKTMMGLYGFNSCLVAIALIDRYPNKYLLTLFAILLSILLTRAFEMVTIPALTAPFVITTWLMMGFVKLKSGTCFKRHRR